MARNVGPRTVQCYHCRHRFEVGGRTQSTSCPGCNKPVIVEDVVVDRLRAGLVELRTCGKVTIKKKGRLMVAKTVEAHGGVECEGVLEAGTVISGQTVVMGKSCQWHGDLTAPAVVMEAGAKVKPSRFNVPGDPLELSDLPQRE